MKNCPHCGAELAEGSQFCLYCMTGLTDKPNVTPRLRKRLPIVLIIGALCLAVLIGAVALWPKQNAAEPEASPSPASSDVICTFDDMTLRATYLTGKDGLSDLWDPDGFINTHTGTDSDGDTWQIYSTDVYLDGVTLKVAFCQDGEEILVALTGSTEQTYADSVRLAKCVTESVYNYTFTDIADMLTDHDTYPMSQIAPEGCVIRLAELPDGTSDQTDSGTSLSVQRLAIEPDQELFEGQHLFFDLQTRTYQGIERHDIYLLFTQE